MGWEDMVFLVGVVAVTCWICWPTYEKPLAKWNPTESRGLQRLKITGDTPKPNLTTKVKGSEILNGRFMINDKFWVEIIPEAIERMELDPNKYYEIEYRYE